MATRRSKAKNASPSSNSPPPSPAATRIPRVFASMTRMTRAPLGMRNEVLILLVLFLTSLAVLSSEDVGEYDTYAHSNNGGMDMVMDEVMMAMDSPQRMDAAPMMAKGGAAFRMSADPPPPPPPPGVVNLGAEFLQDLDSNLKDDAAKPSFKKMLMRDGSLTMSTAFTSPPTSPLPANVRLIPSHTSFSSLTENLRKEVSRISGAYVENERANSHEHYFTGSWRKKGHGSGSSRSSNVDRLVRLRNLAMTVKIPSESYEDFMQSLASMSEKEENGVQITEQSSNVKDVTNSYIDVVSRISVLESSEKALRRLMGAASTTRDVLDVERQLRNVINDKEGQAKQKAFYENGISLSTVRITLNERPPVTFDDPVDDTRWDPTKTVTKALNSLETGLVHLSDALIYTIIWAIPVLGAFWVGKMAWEKTMKRGGTTGGGVL
ncbi:hypothetical protein TrCOL_g12969 [Triparma columacea]|uniref:DUF4349 domain-containing protein n=1 Tax=Triparma columacea TaxID=722753 RepID=A0A9W7GGX4_9STRA|nr:hypothetical protein TrCOL_g12969 [Triparma columacea]